MTELTDTQRTILAAAAIRPGMRVLPLPEQLKGGAAKKVLTALATRGLVEETAARPGEPTLRDDITLILTAAAFTALGIAPPADDKPAPAPIAKPQRRDGTKQAQLIAMLAAPSGATVEEIAEATSWQHHTVRGAIAGALKKRLGLEVTSEKVEGRGRVYRIKR